MPWARLFTIEYSVLFDAILPALERLGLPVLLGGTSNHFPRHVLDEVGAWDAFNVTSSCASPSVPDPTGSPDGPRR